MEIAKPALGSVPELTKIGKYFDKDKKGFPRNLMSIKAKCVRDTSEMIKTSTGTPQLISLK